MTLGHGPSTTTDGLLYCMDFLNPRCYPGSGTTFTNLGSVSTTTTIYNSTYYSISNGLVQFTRSTTATKDGSVLRSSAALTGTALAASSFLYNDHTWEVTFRIDDAAPGNYDATEGGSVLSVYNGYHSGYIYTSTDLSYYVWTAGPTILQVCSWTVGAGKQISPGQWYTVATVKSGSTWIPYLNGANVGNGSTNAISNPGVITDYINFGASQLLAAGLGTYMYYAKNTISGSRMYNRALSEKEIANNFNSTRGRFGI